MNKIIKFFFFAVLVFHAFSCTYSQKTKIIIYTKSPIGAKLYINRVPYFNEPKLISDSAIIRNNRDSLIFYIPKNHERLFEVLLNEKKLKVTFINDSKLIRIHIDYFSQKYQIDGSTASKSLIDFGNSQLKIAAITQKLYRVIDSLQRNHKNVSRIKILSDSLDRKLAAFSLRYVRYADTVRSPAAFIEVYNNIDFDNNYRQLKRFIMFNAGRFPSYKPIQEIKKKALSVVRVYEQEFNIGDKLPYISLPDTSGKLRSTSLFKGKYYLIDFWSTWCQQCIVFKDAEKKINNKFSNKVKIVSVAIDDQDQVWKKMISYNKLNWMQLIDKKMWEGPAVNTLLFDSIPFNFLVDPTGIIIKKAIKPDSLNAVLSNLNANRNR
ncbi:TlpA family protein disulfide reductase [Mucilaginibacter sp.]